MRQIRGVLVFGLLTINTVFWFVPLFALAILKLLLPWQAVRGKISGWLMAIGENWISTNTLILSPIGSKRWRNASIEGELKRNGWYLVIANHQTWVDIVVLQALFNRRIPFLKFFIKQELIWFPFLGIAWWALDMPFMKRYSPSYLARHPEKKGRDLEATRKACEKFRESPVSVINFVEGTRFSEDKRVSRESPYRHLLQPRAGGIAIALDSMGELFDAVLDVTIAYRGQPPSFWAMCCGQRVDCKIQVRQLNLSEAIRSGDYAADREFRRRVHRWLSDVWQEKDASMTALLDSDPKEAS